MIDQNLDVFFFGVLEFPGEALKYPRGRRAITLMSLPPRRREERQQSMAVLPTPMISTRSPIDVDMSECDRFQPVDADVNAVRVVPSRQIEFFAARRAGADENRIVAAAASNPFMLSMGVL